MTPLQRFVQYCIIFNTVLNIMGFCSVKLDLLQIVAPEYQVENLTRKG
ncbi:hypothetical protein [Merismopedia glauca]|nr:hypothetical protein [Merismopedia glauca]